MSVVEARSRGLAIFSTVALAALASYAVTAAPETPTKPRLGVLVVFDQMRGDYLSRWNELFVADGLKRLEHDGTWFTDCNYPYACTMTGPGHASILSGCSPDRHGIITNDWYDRAAAEMDYCAGSDRYETVLSFPAAPAPPVAKIPENAKDKESKDGEEGAAKGPKKKIAGSPERMLAPTLADSLKAATGHQAKVVCLSLKDRSSVLPGGKMPDACYWFDSKTGTFCTSTYYRDRPHDWVNAFNAGRPADGWFSQTWLRLRSDIDYVKYSGPDDDPSESTGVVKLQGRVFPHPMDAGLKKPGTAYYDTVTTSPFGNELLLALAERAIISEGLGRHAVPDLLTISFSSNDLIGHAYGPDSQEVMDVTLRSDLIVRDLLALLDKQVGAGRYTLALTADHGVCPFPEVARRQGKEAERIRPLVLLAGVTDFFTKTYGARPDEKGAWIENLSFPWIYLNQQRIKSRQLDPAEVAQALADYLRKQAPIQAVYTRADLDGTLAVEDVIGRRVQKGYRPERSGDLAIVTKPYYLLSTGLTGTTHGTPHSYDTHVPLLAFGPGIPGGPCAEPVTPQAAAAILARALGVPRPALAEAPLPKRLGGP